MLSLFPELLFLSPFAALFIRLALAAVFGYSAWMRIQRMETLIKVFGGIDAIIAVMLILGFYTQLAAALGIICTMSWLIKRDWNPYPKSTAALALVMSAALLVLGAGPLAFDLPL